MKELTNVWNEEGSNASFACFNWTYGLVITSMKRKDWSGNLPRAIPLFLFPRTQLLVHADAVFILPLFFSLKKRPRHLPLSARNHLAGCPQKPLMSKQAPEMGEVKFKINLAATLFTYFIFFSFIHVKSQSYSTFIHLHLPRPLSISSLPIELGLPHGRPAHYQLSYAAPISYS
jgi:hypothetical protein